MKEIAIDFQIITLCNGFKSWNNYILLRMYAPIIPQLKIYAARQRIFLLHIMTQ